MTISQAFERYMAYQENRIKESTYVDIVTVFNHHILPRFGSKKLNFVQTKDIVAWQTDLNKKNLSYLYKNKLLGYLKGFFNYCVHIDESLRSNPVKQQLRFVNTNVAKEMLIYSPDEYKRFRSVINSARDIVIFDLLYFTGIRKGELMALLWQDLRHNILSVNKTFTRRTRDSSWKITPPKSKNSIREILLPEFLVKELEILRKQTNGRFTDYIVGNETPLSERCIDLARDKYFKLADVKRIRIHDFRHSHVSFLISENVDPISVAKRVGDTVETVLSTYSHLMPNKQHAIVQKLDLLLMD